MKQLVLMRHGDAESLGLNGDRSRKLTEFGRNQAKSTAQQLSSLCTPTTVIHSPYARAVETADIVANCFSSEIEKFTENTITPGNSIAEFIECVAGYEYTSSLLVVTHNPVVSYVASTLAPREGSIAFRTAQAIVFEVGDFPRDMRIAHIVLPTL